MPKKRKKKINILVIFARPEQQKGPGTLYISKDGKTTELRNNAAKFYSFEEAKRFAKEKNIELTALTYIGNEHFKESEI